ncbi:MAG: cell wall hydrolase [Sphingomonas sp.]|nr:cell wall hydrolase [Sphingomonas sp.]
MGSWAPRAAALLALATIGYSAQAAIRAIIDHLPANMSEPAPRGFDAQDHFPGAALLYDAPLPPAERAAATGAAPDFAAPAAGVTGTAPLPDLPMPSNAAALAMADGTIKPAAPFSMARASGQDLGRALNCLTTAIYYEAASEPDAGQRAVAQVILNRVRHPAFPATVCGVVYQGSERAGCQFSFACDGAMARQPSRAGWARALRNASLMLAGGVEASVGTATHYHTYAVTPAWNRALVMTAAIGAHFFHRWKGYWGTPAAFAQRYAGGEPVPGPHPRAVPLLPPVTMASASLPPAALGFRPPSAPLTVPPAPVTAPSNIQPAYAASGTARTDTLPDSQILDKWKDSGKPLR